MDRETPRHQSGRYVRPAEEISSSCAHNNSINVYSICSPSLSLPQHYHVRVHTQSVQFDQNHIRSDFSRLGRILTGTSVGLVLGGGGARYVRRLDRLYVCSMCYFWRLYPSLLLPTPNKYTHNRGMAHLGLLRVLEEEGIPIDHIVGVSVGAFIGGLYAKHSSYLEILPHASRFAQNMSSTWLFVKDFTLPFTSYFNGYSFGRELEKVCIHACN